VSFQKLSSTEMAKKIVDVQPLSGPAGWVAYFRYRYKQNQKQDADLPVEIKPEKKKKYRSLDDPWLTD
jgi:hypothetical protein